MITFLAPPFKKENIPENVPRFKTIQRNDIRDRRYPNTWYIQVQIPSIEGTVNTKDYEITFGGSFAIRIGRARPHFNTHSHSPVINQAVFDQLSSSEAIQHFWYPTGAATVEDQTCTPLKLVDVSQRNVAIPLESYLSARKSTDELSTKIYTRVYIVYMYGRWGDFETIPPTRWIIRSRFVLRYIQQPVTTMMKKEGGREREREKKEKKRGERKKIALGRLLCQWRREISPRYPCLTTWSRVINTLLDSFLHARHSKSFLRCLWPRMASTSRRGKRWIRILLEEIEDSGIKIIEFWKVLLIS